MKTKVMMITKVFVTLVCLGGLVCLATNLGRSRTIDNIKIGMNEENVLRLMGVPTSTEVSLRRLEHFSNKDDDKGKSVEVIAMYWEEPNIIYIVEIDLKDRIVVYKNYANTFKRTNWFERMFKNLFR